MVRISIPKKLYPFNKVGHHRPASQTPYKWRFADGPMMSLNIFFSDSPLSLADPQSGDTGLLRYRLGDQPVTEGGCEIEIERSDDDSSSDSDTTDSNDVSAYMGENFQD